MSVLTKIKPSNPLSIIALFAALSEVAMTVTVLQLDEGNRGTFLWFTIIFPFLLITMFFLVLFVDSSLLYEPKKLKRNEPSETKSNESQSIPKEDLFPLYSTLIFLIHNEKKGDVAQILRKAFSRIGKHRVKEFIDFEKTLLESGEIESLKCSKHLENIL